jgi:ribonuclease HII
MNLRIEKYYWKKGYKKIIGLDEAGRGPLAGPVTAAAVVVNSKMTAQLSSPCKRGSQTLSPRKRGFPLEFIPAKAGAGMTSQNFREILKNTRDSKKLSAKQREKLFKLIKRCSFLKFSYASVSEKVIDKINIEQATFLAMKNCLTRLNFPLRKLRRASLVLVDGNRKIPKINYPQKTIIKGDDKILSIALASIIAKVIRDKKIITLAKKYPHYHFEIHKGYPTKLHRKLLKKYGPCKIHRRTFKLHC